MRKIDLRLLALLRELHDLGATTRYINNRGTFYGRPVHYRNRWMWIPHNDGQLPHVVVSYSRWPADDTFTVHAYWGKHFNRSERLIMPVATFDDVLRLWAEIKPCLDRNIADAQPIRMGQLDIFDLIGEPA